MKLSPLLIFFCFLLAVSVSLSCARDFESAADALDFLRSPADAAEPPGGDPWRIPRIFDVTDYGAVADGNTESSLEFMVAWEEACAYPGRSVLYVPQGTFFVGETVFSGPCFNDLSPKVLILGTLRAPTALDDADVWIHFKSLHHLDITGGDTNTTAILDGQGAQTWSNSACRRHFTCDIFATSLKLSDVSYGRVSNIEVVDSKGFHVALHGCDNIHLSGFNIRAPGDSQNTDGIHVSQSTNINITSSDIGVGDDCVSIGPGSVNVSVSDINCGPGHGISVGSLGRYQNEMDVVGIRVENCSINGTTNGVRIKTWPGQHSSIATNLTFQNIVMSNVSNPIVIDQQYCPNHSCKTHEASNVKLSEIKMRNISGSYNSEFAVNLQCSSGKACEKIELSYINLTATQPPDQNHQIGRFNCNGALHAFTILNSTF